MFSADCKVIHFGGEKSFNQTMAAIWIVKFLLSLLNVTWIAVIYFRVKFKFNACKQMWIGKIESIFKIIFWQHKNFTYKKKCEHTYYFLITIALKISGRGSMKTEHISDIPVLNVFWLLHAIFNPSIHPSIHLHTSYKIITICFYHRLTKDNNFDNQPKLSIKFVPFRAGFEPGK